jgi:hypothetical protein
MSQAKVEVVKSPIPPIRSSDCFSARSNAVIYYIRLSNGIVVTRPEDFPENLEKKKYVQ